MSITDELREYARIHQPYKSELYNAQCADEITAIADRIDVEHEEALSQAYMDVSDSEWIRLPVDADGVPWHIGDRTESGQTVGAMGLNKHGWHFVGTVNEIDPAIHRHYHTPTVEDVLREFAYGLGVPVADSYIAASAAKLRLAEGEDA